jgi:phosphoglycolate phosphatase-like HAD superfamily hydrolase
MNDETGYDAVVFDNDGVLVHPPAPETQAAAVRDAFLAVGAEDPAERHVRDLMSGVTVEVLEEIGGAYDVDPEALWAAREHHDERSQLEAFRAGDRDRYDDIVLIEKACLWCSAETTAVRYSSPGLVRS